MKVRMKSWDEGYRRATRNFWGHCRFLGIEAIRQTTSRKIYEEGYAGKIFMFFLKDIKTAF